MYLWVGNNIGSQYNCPKTSEIHGILQEYCRNDWKYAPCPVE